MAVRMCSLFLSCLFLLFACFNVFFRCIMSSFLDFVLSKTLSLCVTFASSRTKAMIDRLSQPSIKKNSGNAPLCNRGRIQKIWWGNAVLN